MFLKIIREMSCHSTLEMNSSAFLSFIISFISFYQELKSEVVHVSAVLGPISGRAATAVRTPRVKTPWSPAWVQIRIRRRPSSAARTARPSVPLRRPKSTWTQSRTPCRLIRSHRQHPIRTSLTALPLKRPPTPPRGHSRTRTWSRFLPLASLWMKDTSAVFRTVLAVSRWSGKTKLQWIKALVAPPAGYCAQILYR